MQDDEMKPSQSGLDEDLMILLDLTDAVIDKLVKVEALAWL